MKIGALAKATSTKVETIRYYEQIGLLASPGRTDANYRDYDKVHLDRLSFIRRSRHLGFSLETVRGLLDLADEKSRSCEAVDAIARAHLESVEQRLADLQSLRNELTRIVNSCQQGSVADCKIIEALAPISA